MKIIFWNVDTQYDFMRSDGKLYVKNAEAIEGNLARLTNLAKEKNIQVVNTVDWHNEYSEEISDNPDFVKTFPRHCMQNTKGALFVPATDPEDPYIIDWSQASIDERMIKDNRNLVLYKDKFDIFTGSPYAEEIVRLLQPEKAIVYGVATNVCVDCAVKGLLERKVQVYVPTDAIKELPGSPMPYKSWKGAVLTTTNDMYKMLEGRI